MCMGLGIGRDGGVIGGEEDVKVGDGEVTKEGGWRWIGREEGTYGGEWVGEGWVMQMRAWRGTQ